MYTSVILTITAFKYLSDRKLYIKCKLLLHNTVIIIIIILFLFLFFLIIISDIVFIVDRY